MPATDREEVVEADAGVETMGAALDFLRLLWSVDHALQSSAKRTERAQGATGPQQLVLRIMSMRQSTTAGQLASVLHLHPSTLTGILQRLEEHGMISRKDDPADARRTLLLLTAKGRKLITGRTSAGETAVKKVMARMPGKVDAARELLAAVTEELDLLGR